MTIHLYGIPNCDTVKKARLWLEARGIDYTFHDYKKEGADPAKVSSWIAARGVETILNTRGTTWRKLAEAEKTRAEDPKGAAQLLVEHPSMIKRPVVEHDAKGGSGLLVGFKADEWQAALA